jgi:hypothetical protein
MTDLFYDATAFNQKLCWDSSRATDFFSGTSCPVAAGVKSCWGQGTTANCK